MNVSSISQRSCSVYSQPVSEEDWMQAALEGDLQTIQRLLLLKKDLLDRRAEDGQTALMCAASEGHVEVVKVLIQAGAELDLYDDGELIQAGISFDSDNYKGKTALMLAACQDHAAAALALIQAGADVNLQGEIMCWTALMFAAFLGHTKIAQMLIPNTNLNYQNSGGTSVLELAADNGNAAIVKALINGCVSLDTRNWRGKTPLMCAASKGHVEVVKALIQAGVSLDLEDKDGQTALMHAKKNSKDETVLVLEDTIKERTKLAFLLGLEEAD